MKTFEEIINYLEVEIDWARMYAQNYLAEYMKGDLAFIPLDKCLELHNSYLSEYIKLNEVLNFIKGDVEK